MTKIVSRDHAHAPAHDRFTAQILDHDQEHQQDVAWRRYSPTLAWISYRRETFSKVSLLALGFLFLVRLASLLLWTRT
jgi:hypothetical protein